MPVFGRVCRFLKKKKNFQNPSILSETFLNSHSTHYNFWGRKKNTKLAPCFSYPTLSGPVRNGHQGQALSKASTASLTFLPKSIGAPVFPVIMAVMPRVSFTRSLSIMVRPQTSRKLRTAAALPLPGFRQ